VITACLTVEPKRRADLEVEEAAIERLATDGLSPERQYRAAVLLLG
jgi:hypothetical protein